MKSNENINNIIKNIIKNIDNKEDKNITFKEFCIKRRIDFKLKTTKLPKYLPLIIN
jgi:CRISPR/Cas system CMR-associated protein Cmr5 small subunit